MSQKYKVKMQISYNGAHYEGWQKQKHETRKPTLQETVEKTLSQLLNEPISVCASGRTDAGVHAINQYLHFWTTKDPKNYNLVHALNGRWTTKHIVYKKAWLAPHDFHAIGSSVTKTYKYLIHNHKLPSALQADFTAHIHYPLQLQRLNEFAKPFLGTHDFKSFQTSGTPVPDTKRTIYTSQWKRLSKNLIEYEVSGDGFLRQMVRNIVGTQLYMHRNNSSPGLISEILAKKNRQAAYDTAPASGLYLYNVKYPLELDNQCREL